MSKINNFNNKELYTSYVDGARERGLTLYGSSAKVLAGQTMCARGAVTLNSKKALVYITYSTKRTQKTAQEDLKGTSILSSSASNQINYQAYGISKKEIEEKFQSSIEQFHKSFDNLRILKGRGLSEPIKTDSASKLDDLPEEIKTATSECMDSLYNMLEIMLENNLCKVDLIDLGDSEAKKAYIDDFMGKLNLLSADELMKCMGQIAKDTEKLLSKNGFKPAGLTEKWELNKEILELSKINRAIFTLELDFFKETYVVSALDAYYNMQAIDQVSNKDYMNLDMVI